MSLDMTEPSHTVFTPCKCRGAITIFAANIKRILKVKYKEKACEIHEGTEKPFKLGRLLDY